MGGRERKGVSLRGLRKRTRDGFEVLFGEDHGPWRERRGRGGEERKVSEVVATELVQREKDHEQC